MRHCDRKIDFFLAIISLFTFISCASHKKEPELFEVLDNKATGLNFTNHLASTDSFNLFKYMYFYNGAGMAAGDFNNDGLIDIYFASNQGNNSMFLNEGKLSFRDVTTSCGIPLDKAWSTGVSVV